MAWPTCKFTLGSESSSRLRILKWGRAPDFPAAEIFRLCGDFRGKIRGGGGARNKPTGRGFGGIKSPETHENRKRLVEARNFPISEKWGPPGVFSRFAGIRIFKPNSGVIEKLDTSPQA